MTDLYYENFVNLLSVNVLSNNDVNFNIKIQSPTFNPYNNTSSRCKNQSLQIENITIDDIEKISDRYTIETFLKSFYEKRKGIFSDLYWDMDLLTKNIFIDAKRIERININNGNADKFDVIYNKYLKIVTDAVNKSR